MQLAKPDPVRFLPLFLMAVGLLINQLASVGVHAQTDRATLEPTITIQKYVVGVRDIGNLSAYSVTVLPDGTVDYYGIVGRTKGRQILKLSRGEYLQALRVFDEVSFDQLESAKPNPFSIAVASVTLFRDGIRKTVDFDHISAAYAKLIRGLEENLKIKGLICPRLQLDKITGETRDLCVIEDQKLDEALKEAK